MRTNGASTNAVGGSHGENRIVSEYDAGASNGASSLQFHTHAGGDAVAERLRITSAGDVGVGTTAPGEKLEVDGNVKVAGSHQLGGYSAPPMPHACGPHRWTGQLPANYGVILGSVNF